MTLTTSNPTQQPLTVGNFAAIRFNNSEIYGTIERETKHLFFMKTKENATVCAGKKLFYSIDN